MRMALLAIVDFALGFACMSLWSWHGALAAERDQAHVIPLPPCARNGHYPAQMKSARRR